MEIALFKIKANNLLAFSLFSLFFFTKRGVVFHRELLVPTAAIFCSILISSFGSVHLPRCLGYAAVYLFELAVYFLLPFSFFFHFDRERIVRLYFLSFQVIGLYAFCQLLFSMAELYDPFLRQWIEKGGWARAHGLSYEPSFYALYMCGFVITYNALYLFSIEKRSLLKLLFVNWLLLLSTATSGFFAYLIFLPVCFFFRRYAIDFKKKLSRLFLCLFSFLAFMTLAIPKIALFFFKFFILGFLTHHSFAERWEAIVNAWSVFCERPWTGVGIGGIGPYLFYREKVGEIPHPLYDLNLQEVELFDPKNVATEILAGLGIFGAAAFLLLGIAIWKSCKTALLLPRSFERSLALSLFISLFVMILVLQFNSGLFRCYIWVHVAIALGYSASLSSKLAPSAMSQCPSPSFPS
jgi:hypothetical protein